MLMILLLALAVAPQEAPPPAAAPPDLAALVRTQFGEDCTPAPVTPHTVGGKPQAPTVLVTGDLDGDGAEDAVIVAKCSDPLAASQDHNYKVQDPYNTYFGFGNPKVTRSFGSADPDRDRKLLVIHGWRLPEPKAKFILINVPFDRLAIRRILFKKKTRPAIEATESGIMNSYLVWDGKKYRWEPGESE